MQRPAGVTVVATLFSLTATYLFGVGATMLVRPGLVSMAAGEPLLGGLETAGPYMFLLTSAVVALIGWGLLRMHNWARRVGAIAALIGIVLLVPAVSAAAIGIHLSTLVWGGLGIIVRMAVVWYLWQTPVAEQFGK